jgi:hypothetical protein
MGRAHNTNGEKRNAYGIFVGKSDERRPLGRARRRWMDNINMDHRELGWGWCEPDRCFSGQGSVEGSCEHGNEPPGSIKFWEVLE